MSPAEVKHCQLRTPEPEMITPGYNMLPAEPVEMGLKTYNLARQLTLLTVQQQQGLGLAMEGGAAETDTIHLITSHCTIKTILKLLF